MRVVCDSCGATYKIPDEKLRKEVNKATCRKCGHRMLIRRPGSVEPNQGHEPAQGSNISMPKLSPTPIGAMSDNPWEEEGPTQIQPSPLLNPAVESKPAVPPPPIPPPSSPGNPVATPAQPNADIGPSQHAPKSRPPNPSKPQSNSNQQSDLRAVFLGSLLASLGAILLAFPFSTSLATIQFTTGVVLCLTGSLLGMFILFTGENGQRKASVGLSIGLAMVVGLVGAFLAQVLQDAEPNDSAKNDPAQRDETESDQDGGDIDSLANGQDTGSAIADVVETNPLSEDEGQMLVQYRTLRDQAQANSWDQGVTAKRFKATPTEQQLVLTFREQIGLLAEAEATAKAEAQAKADAAAAEERRLAELQKQDEEQLKSDSMSREDIMSYQNSDEPVTENTTTETTPTTRNSTETSTSTAASSSNRTDSAPTVSNASTPVRSSANATTTPTSTPSSASSSTSNSSAPAQNIVSIMIKNNASVKRCYGMYKKTHGSFPSETIVLSVTLQSSGTVSRAYVTNASYKDTEIDYCLSGRIKQIQFPGFSGSDVNYRIPLPI